MFNRKLTFILPSLRGGGAERVILTLTELMLRKGYIVELVLIRSIGAFSNELPEGLKVIDLGRKRALFSLFALGRYLRSSSPEVIFPSLPHISIVTLISTWITRTKTVVIPIEHNTLSESIRYSPSMKQSLLPFLMRLTYPRARTVICVSQGVQRDLQRKLSLPPEKLMVIYNPVITEMLDSLSKQAVCHPWLSCRTKPVLVAAGRLTYAKGFDVLIDAMEIVCGSSNARLIILGAGPDEANLKQQIVEKNLSDHISMPGFIANPYPFFRLASIFVLSSRWEGLPTVLIEAAACGTNIVSTDCPSGPREILDSETSQELVPVGDHQALANQILDVLEKRLTPQRPRDFTQFTAAYAQKQYDKLINKELSNLI